MMSRIAKLRLIKRRQLLWRVTTPVSANFLLPERVNAGFGGRRLLSFGEEVNVIVDFYQIAVFNCLRGINDSYSSILQPRCVSSSIM